MYVFGTSVLCVRFDVLLSKDFLQFLTHIVRLLRWTIISFQIFHWKQAATTTSRNRRNRRPTKHSLPQAFCCWLCFLICWRLINAYGELHFRSLQSLLIVLFRNNFIFICPGYLIWNKTMGSNLDGSDVYIKPSTDRQTVTNRRLGTGQTIQHIDYETSWDAEIPIIICPLTQFDQHS